VNLGENAMVFERAYGALSDMLLVGKVERIEWS
jgi:hypothetical protein